MDVKARLGPCCSDSCQGCARRTTSKEQTPTTSFQLPHVVAGEPPTLAVERALPPAPILLPAHADDVTLGEGELVLVGLLEGEARLDQHTPTALGHVLGERKHQTDRADELEGIYMYVCVYISMWW